MRVWRVLVGLGGLLWNTLMVVSPEPENRRLAGLSTASALIASMWCVSDSRHLKSERRHTLMDLSHEPE